MKTIRKAMLASLSLSCLLFGAAHANPRADALMR